MERYAFFQSQMITKQQLKRICLRTIQQDSKSMPLFNSKRLDSYLTYRDYFNKNRKPQSCLNSHKGRPINKITKPQRSFISIFYTITMNFQRISLFDTNKIAWANLITIFLTILFQRYTEKKLVHYFLENTKRKRIQYYFKIYIQQKKILNMDLQSKTNKQHKIQALFFFFNQLQQREQMK